MTTDADWMRLALAEARAAGERGEVPVGAVLVKEGVRIATGHNAPVTLHDPTAHAEIRALRAGALALGNYRLDGCTLYVTLEPCAMCAGAILQARLDRVVFGAAEPKSGAAGSVLDLFAQPLLNHRTRVDHGVLAEECAGLLQSFFRQRREQARRAAQPLRDDALRTPEARFDGLSGFGFASHWISDLPAQRGWRMHYLDEGPADVAGTVLCLHAPGQWSYFFRHLMREPGLRWLAPDLIGFGRSDKPKRAEVHALAWHAQVMVEWLDRLRVDQATLAPAAGASALAGLLRARAPDRFARIVGVPDSGIDDDPGLRRAWAAPFPDRGHEAAIRALGGIGPHPDGPSPAQCARIAADAMGYSPP